MSAKSRRRALSWPPSGRKFIERALRAGAWNVVFNLVTPEERRARQKRIKTGRNQDGGGEDRRQRNEVGSPRNE
jgi:hypothetical protein